MNEEGTRFLSVSEAEIAKLAKPKDVASYEYNDKDFPMFGPAKGNIMHVFDVRNNCLSFRLLWSRANADNFNAY